jgi:hypothetical protein
MNSDKDAISVLLEDIDEEVLERMPEWFRKLKDSYERRASKLRFRF